MEKGAWPKNKEGSREQGNLNLGAGSTKKMQKGERSSQKLGHGDRRERNYQGARGEDMKIKGSKEQREMKRDHFAV